MWRCDAAFKRIAHDKARGVHREKKRVLYAPQLQKSGRRDAAFGHFLFLSAERNARRKTNASPSSKSCASSQFLLLVTRKDSNHAPRQRQLRTQLSQN